MAQVDVSTDFESPYAMVDVWFVNPTCGPSRMVGCTAVLIGSYIYDFASGEPLPGQPAGGSLRRVLQKSVKRQW